MLALNIVQSTIRTQNGYPGAIPDSRLIIYPVTEPDPADVIGYRLKYYDTLLSASEGVSASYYDEDVYNYTYTASDDSMGSEATLVVFGMNQGEFCRHSVSVENLTSGSVTNAYRFKVPKSDWSQEMIFRLYSSSKEDDLYLLYMNTYESIVQRYNGTAYQTYNLVSSVDFTSDSLYNIVTLTNSGGDVLQGGFDSLVYMSQRLHTAVRTIQLVALGMGGSETEIVRMEFKENTQIELCKGTTLFTYLSIHFDGQPSTLSDDEEEAI